MIKLTAALSALLFVLAAAAAAAAATNDKPPAWWQFSLFLNKNLKKYGVLPSIPCNDYNLTPRQQEICTNPRYAGLMVSLGTSVNLAARVCIYSFQNRLWRCPFSDDEYVLGKIVGRQTKESAAIYSLIAGIAMYTATRDCAVGFQQMDKLCGCARRPSQALTPDLLQKLSPEFYQKIRASSKIPTELDWGGCIEDIEMGYRLTKEFVDDTFSPSVSDDRLDSLVKLQNSEQGRGLVNDSRTTKCYCHGPSGSCNVQTCWKEMKNWNEIGLDVKKAYDAAVQVKLNNKGTKIINSDATLKKFTENDLVYIQPSPSFCERNETAGIEGTHGRPCDISDVAENRCSVLCCQRGHKVMTKLQSYACGRRLQMRPPPIKFVVKYCTKVVNEYFCN